MHHVMNGLKPTAFLAAIGGCALFGLLVAATMVLGSQEAAATPAYAQQTGKPCGQCHVNTAGGGKLTSFGSKFQANGHKL